MSELTRAQVEEYTARFRNCGFLYLQQVFDAHDAALRARVAELEQHNTNLQRLADSQEFRAEQAEGTMRERVEQDQQLAHQLAAVTARVAELEAENNALIQEIAQAESDLGITQRQLAAMTLTWTTGKPTVAGWWYTKSRYGKRVSVTIQRVKQWEDGGFYIYAGKPVERHDCEWAGPIQPPKGAT